jgi:hypothetical protein
MDDRSTASEQGGDLAQALAFLEVQSSGLSPLVRSPAFGTAAGVRMRAVVHRGSHKLCVCVHLVRFNRPRMSARLVQPTGQSSRTALGTPPRSRLVRAVVPSKRAWSDHVLLSTPDGPLPTMADCTAARRSLTCCCCVAAVGDRDRTRRDAVKINAPVTHRGCLKIDFKSRALLVLIIRLQPRLSPGGRAGENFESHPVRRPSGGGFRWLPSEPGASVS